jgi:hypothetical protein
MQTGVGEIEPREARFKDAPCEYDSMYPGTFILRDAVKAPPDQVPFQNCERPSRSGPS